MAIRNVALLEAPWVNGSAETDVVGAYPEAVDGDDCRLRAPDSGLRSGAQPWAVTVPATSTGAQPNWNYAAAMATPGLTGSIPTARRERRGALAESCAVRTAVR